MMKRLNSCLESFSKVESMSSARQDTAGTPGTPSSERPSFPNRRNKHFLRPGEMHEVIESLNAGDTLEHNWEWTDMARKRKLKGFQARAKNNIYLEVHLKSGSSMKLLLGHVYITANNESLMILRRPPCNCRW